MNKDERAEINEIRQVFNDIEARVKRAYGNFNKTDRREEGFKDLVQASKVIARVKDRLKKLSDGHIIKIIKNPHKMDSGSYT